jgi:hypothetical protein
MAGKPESWKDWRGQKFGTLTFLRKSEKRYPNATCFLWEAQCELCNRILFTKPHLVANGYTKCFCVPRKRRNPDHTNQKIGMVTMLKKTKKKCHSMSLWLCQCDCGNFIERTYTHLLILANANCGCVRKAKQITREQEKAKQKAEQIKKQKHPAKLKKKTKPVVKLKPKPNRFFRKAS